MEGKTIGGNGVGEKKRSGVVEPPATARIRTCVITMNREQRKTIQMARKEETTEAARTDTGSSDQKKRVFPSHRACLCRRLSLAR